MALQLSKEKAVLQLKKRQEHVQKICLTKQPLENLTARVAVVIDVSGSMYDAISSGEVQAAIERLLPLAMQFDDNGEMELWVFNESFKKYPSVTLDNFYGYIREHKIDADGGTNYAPVLADVGKYFLIDNPENLPNYVIFITDGENSDKDETDRVIKTLSKHPMFIQFVGIGEHRSFKYLSELDNMTGRFVDNANFFAINDIHNEATMSDDTLYNKLLAEYPQWLSDSKVKTMIQNAKTDSNDKKFKKELKSQRRKSINLETVSNVIEIIADIADIFS